MMKIYFCKSEKQIEFKYFSFLYFHILIPLFFIYLFFIPLLFHLLIISSFFFLLIFIKFSNNSIFSATFHRERRKYLISALEEMISILSDQPGLLGPKVSCSTNNPQKRFLFFTLPSSFAVQGVVAVPASVFYLKGSILYISVANETSGRIYIYSNHLKV